MTSIKAQFEFLETVLNALDEPFYVIRVSDYSIVLANKASRILGVKQAHTCYALTHHSELPCESDEHPCPMKHVIHERQPYVVEHVHYEPDGTPYYAEVHGYPLFTAQDEVEYMVEYSINISARKRALVDLENSERGYRALFEQSHDAVFHLDLQGRHLAVNQRAVDLLGYTVEELVSLSYQDTSAEIAESSSVLERLLQGEQIPLYERAFRKKNGESIRVEINAELIRTAGGQPWYIQSVVRDITARKQAEELLRISREEYKSLYRIIRLIADNASDLIWAKDLQGRFLFTNKADANKLLIARDVDEPVGKTDLYFAERERAAHPDDPNWHTFGELCINSDKIIHETQQAQRFEEFGNVQGRFLFLDVYKSPLWDEQGQMIGTVGIGRDVTREKSLEDEYKQTQEALAASEGRLRALLSAMQDVVLVIDRTGIVREIAPTSTILLHRPPAEILGKTLAEVFSIEQAQVFLTLIEKTLETDQTTWTEYKLMIAGRLVWFSAIISPMLEDNVLWVARDITVRKQAQEELEYLAATDPLTGLPNRRRFFRQAEALFKVPSRPARQLTAFMVDVDHFKNINDQYGHAIGDVVLCEIAARLNTNLRPGDLIGRYGGEEFAILLPRANCQVAFQVAERLRLAISSQLFHTSEGKIQVSASFGIASIQESHNSLDELLHDADQALLRAKNIGRNCCVVYQEGFL